MSHHDLQKKLEAQPFAPFRLRLPDGRALDVPHPDFVSISPTGKSSAIVVWSRDGQLESLVDLRLVSDFEPMPKKQGKSR